jgi:hypothetical protein
MNEIYSLERMERERERGIRRNRIQGEFKKSSF